MGAFSLWHWVFVLVLAGGVATIVFLAKRQKSPAPQAQTGAGWFPDPENPALVRWFDGQAWTPDTQPRQ